MKVIILLVIVVTYSSFLTLSPSHLNQDEMGVFLHAYSITKTGYDGKENRISYINIGSK